MPSITYDDKDEAEEAAIKEWNRRVKDSGKGKTDE
jgi:hypothetical protein